MDPTERELKTALEITKVIGKDALPDLRRIRERKTSWLGAPENALRLEIDRFLGFKESP